MSDGPTGPGEVGIALLSKAWEALNAAAAAFDMVKPPQKDMKERVESAGGRVYALACAVLLTAASPTVEDCLWTKVR